jgi:uncharacterized protein YyaL (SSP411 family)
MLPQITLEFVNSRRDISAGATRLREELDTYLTGLSRGGMLGERVHASIEQNLTAGFDWTHGGWAAGESKFPNGAAISFAFYVYEQTGDDRWLEIATKSLDAIAKGGIRDHVHGGIFRVSSDPEWNVPFFEKMSYTNAMAIKNFAKGYEITGDPLYREAALEIVDYVLRTGADQARGGFHASQAADTSPAGGGEYYTWTEGEVRELLTADEFRVVTRYYGIQAEPARATAQKPDRNVLRIVSGVGDLSEQLALPEDQVRALLASGRQKMAEARLAGEAPPVDETVYVGWNAMMVSAFIDAARAFGRDDLLDLAVRTAGFLLDTAYSPGEGMAHSAGQSGSAELGVFDDQAWMAYVMFDLYDATGEQRYVDVAEDLLNAALDRYWDKADGGFFDIPVERQTGGLLARPVKPLLDEFTPAANPIATLAFERLFDVTGNKHYANFGGRALASGVASATRAGSRAATYALAAREHMRRIDEADAAATEATALEP